MSGDRRHLTRHGIAGSRLSRRLFTIATAVFLGMTACHGRPADDVDLARATTVIAESDERADRMLEEQRRLRSELGVLEERQAFLEQRVGDHKDAITQSEGRIQGLKDDLRQKKAETDTYIDQHELPVACAYASQIARGEGEYSEKTRNCARIASMYCAVAMISPTFRSKVARVKQHVDGAEAEARSLKEQISSEQEKLNTERVGLQATEESIVRIANDVAALRQKMLALDGAGTPLR